jgi:hypothetical protein
MATGESQPGIYSSVTRASRARLARTYPLLEIIQYLVPAEFVMSPMLKEAGSFRSNPPSVGIGYIPPLVHKLTDAVDNGSGVVLLILGG